MKTSNLVMACCAVVPLLLSAARAQVDWSAKWIVQNRAKHAMAYDSRCQRIVLFGGEAYGQVLGDTWEWDGSDWRQIFPATSPTPRAEHSMTYDSSRGVVILFGGRDAAGSWTNELWEWDGVTWVERGLSGTGPPAVQLFPCSITYDAARRRAVTVVGYFGSTLDEIWEWDGETWTLALSGFPSGLPAPWSVYGADVAYDAVRRVTVMVVYGLSVANRTLLWDGASLVERPGSAPPGPLIDDPGRGRVVAHDPIRSETYEWNGESWMSIVPATSPPDRVGTALVYDGTRNRVVLLGGDALGGAGPAPAFDTWEWDGANWTERLPFPSPPGGGGHSLTYDSARARVVYYSGSETWEWDGLSWEQKNPAVTPTTRTLPGLTYSRSARRVVLFGGWDQSSSQPLADTWLWDGLSWVEVSPTTSPPARYYHAMAYDDRRGRIVVFGGANAQGTLLGDTWEYNGATWIQRTPAPSPPPRWAHAMAYDARCGQVVLFGGSDGVSSLQDTWEWDGLSWTQSVPTVSPSRRTSHGMTYDSARGRTVLFGGWGSEPFLGDTWEWDGTSWTQRSVGQSPSPRRQSPLAYDEARREAIIFSGAPRGSDTWRYAPTDPATYTTSQTGCPGSAGTPTLTITSPSGYPWLGEPFTVAVTNLAPGHAAAMAAGLSSTQWAGIPLPLSLTFIGMFGCQALCSAEFFFPMPPADPSGTTTWTLGPIPNDPGFLGFRFFTQAWVADAVNPTGLIVSNLGEAIVGGK